jgi:hypothetical protein
MRVVDFADGWSSSAAPVTGVINSTGRMAFANDAAFVAYLTGIGASLAAGSGYFNTTLGLPRDYDGAAWNTNIESLFGGKGNFIAETPFTIANNQITPANVTGLLFNPAVSRSFKVEYQIYRNTTGGGATELAERGILQGVYLTVAGTWEMSPGPAASNAGITFSITNAGQVQYTSSNISGTPASSVMRFVATTMGV